MNKYSDQGINQMRGNPIGKILQFGVPSITWLGYFIFLLFVPDAYALVPSPLVIAIPVLITGATLGLLGGIMAGIIGLPLTLLAHHINNPTAESLPIIRLLVSTAAYCLIGGVGGMLYDLRNQLNDQLGKSREELKIREEIQHELRESERNYRDLFELESDALFIIQNQDGAILEVNGAACNMYGYSREEMLGLKNTDMSAEPEETRAKTQATAPIDKVVKIPLRWHRKKDGTVFPVEITARFIHWKGRSVHIAAIRDITERREAEKELERLAITDSLTGLLNRRQFFSESLELFGRALHRPYELSILMIDLDHFKEVNDQYGHATGDATLQEVARRLKVSVRPTDVVGRYGGEEFAIILPRTDMDETRQIANRLISIIANQPVRVENVMVSVTISMGIAGLEENVTSLDELLQRADQALYTAKEEGRNRWAEWHLSSLN